MPRGSGSKRLTRNEQTRVRIRKTHIVDISVLGIDKTKSLNDWLIIIINEFQLLKFYYKSFNFYKLKILKILKIYYYTFKRNFA